MTIRRNSAEGQTSGTTLTAANSGGGSGTAFAAVPGTGVVAFSTAQAAYGTQSYLVNETTLTALVTYTHTGSGSAVVRCCIRLNALPNAAQDLLLIRAGSANIAKMSLTATNVLKVWDAAGASVKTYASALVVGTWYQCELTATVGTTTANGTIQAGYYPLGSTTPVEANASQVGTANTGTAQITEERAMKNTTGVALNAHFDDIYASDGTSTIPTAPPSANALPTVVGGSYAAMAPGTVNLSGSASDTDGTISTLTWSLVSGPDTPTVSTANGGIGTANATATASVAVTAGNYTFRLTGIDNTGGQTVANVNVYVWPAPGVDAKVSYYNPGTWTSLDATSMVTAVNDVNVATGVQSVLGPVAESSTYGMCPQAPGGDLHFKLDAYQTPGSPQITLTFTAFKNDGTTQIDQQTWQVPAGNATNDFALSAAANTAVSTGDDRRALVYRVAATTA